MSNLNWCPNTGVAADTTVYPCFLYDDAMSTVFSEPQGHIKVILGSAAMRDRLDSMFGRRTLIERLLR
jgi:hypothetical protein